jgi:predicted phosphate transport protein (TIGR00153 family)
MGLLKQKKNPLFDINKEFLVETRNGSAVLLNIVLQYTENKLNKDEISTLIESERKCDRLKEKYVQVLFKEKRALPFLVEDRYNILMMIDGINDRMEIFARYLNVNPFPLFKDIKDEFRDLSKTCVKSIEELINCATLIETNFEEAYKTTFKIEELKRIVRTAKFNLLEKLFQMQDEPIKIYIISKLVSFIYDITSWVEETSDFLRGLIIRYPSK